jgi:hypothetical protein
MIGKLEVGDWPLSPRGKGWVLYVSMGCLQKTQRRYTGQGRPPLESMTAGGPDLGQKSEAKNRPESESKKLRIENQFSRTF